MHLRVLAWAAHCSCLALSLTSRDLRSDRRRPRNADVPGQLPAADPVLRSPRPLPVPTTTAGQTSSCLAQLPTSEAALPALSDRARPPRPALDSTPRAALGFGLHHPTLAASSTRTGVPARAAGILPRPSLLPVRSTSLPGERADPEHPSPRWPLRRTPPRRLPARSRRRIPTIARTAPAPPLRAARSSSPEWRSESAVSREPSGPCQPAASANAPASPISEAQRVSQPSRRQALWRVVFRPACNTLLRPMGRSRGSA